MQTLSLVPTNTPDATAPAGKTIISPKEAAISYAAFFASDSICADVSTYPVKLLHARSNYEISSDSIRLGFPKWAEANKIRVNTKEYSGFLRGLPDRVLSLLPQIVGSSFKPSPEPFFKSRSGALLANTYDQFAPALPASHLLSPAILEEYFSRAFANAQDRKEVVQFLADTIQHPTRRPQKAVVMTGTQGTGKSFLFRLTSAALGGRHTWEKNDYAPAFKQFSEIFPNNLLVSFDDATANKGTYQELKQAITCDSMQVEIKGLQRHVHREVYARIIIFSNDMRPLTIEAADRRLYVTERTEHKVDEAESAAFFVGFNDWFNLPTTPAVLYHYFMSIDTSDFKPGSTVRTATHAEMVGLSTSVLENLLDSFVEEDQIFHNRQLLDYLAANDIKNPVPDVIKLRMAARGYASKRRTVEGCGEAQIWLWQNISGKRRKLTCDELDAIQQAYGRTL